VVMCSTCGHGDFPQNASLFWSALSSADVPEGALKGIRFCTFGMGDRSYTHTFCEAAKLIENRMRELGADRVLEMGVGDDRDEEKWETGFNKWLPDFWKASKASEPSDDGSPKTPLYDLTRHDDCKLVPTQICPPGAALLPVIENRQMTPSDYERDIRHFAVSTKNIDFPFDLGDAVAMYYQNLGGEVDEALKHFGYNGDQCYTVTCVSDNVSDRARKAFQQRTTVRQILTEMLDLFGRPSKSFCVDLARYANNAEKKQLLELAKGGPDWQAVADKHPSFFDICLQFGSAKPTLEHLMSIVPLTKPRLYSVASSPFYESEKLELTIVINCWKNKSGETKTGACTRFIQKVPVGNKVAAAAVVGTFKFPENDETPMVMVGLGTGIAPIRSFMQDKLYKKQKGVKTGPMVVFYGCRREKEELFYKDEWARYKKEGILTELQGAFQFDNGTSPPKQVFVGDKMGARPELITDNLLDKGGFFYMCGPSVATPSVQKALKDAVSGKGGFGQEKATTWFDKFMEDGRYSEESY